MKSIFISILMMIASFPGCTHERSSLNQPDTSFVRDYRFGGGKISRNVLESYLSRAITMAEFCTGKAFLVDGPYSHRDDDVRMLRNIGAKFIGRSVYLWGGENKVNNPDFWHSAHQVIDKMHHFDPQIIFQACIFEIITTKVNTVKIPSRVLKEFGLPAESRNFCYDSMINKNGLLVNHWSRGASVPDISRLETRMWFFYLATGYINIGIEAIHFGQVELMSMEDRNRHYYNWADLLSRVRRYAKKHARRKMILCDGHLPGGGIAVDRKLLFDFHSFPSRPVAVADKPQQAILQKGFIDAFYGRSEGGITPSGWKCEHLPYLVELDNFGISPQPGKIDPNGYFIWGYDEISWFSLQPEAYRNSWLQYAWSWVRRTDKNGFLEMPGSRVITGVSKGPERRYRANTKSIHCPMGFSQEETIRRLWLMEGQ